MPTQINQSELITVPRISLLDLGVELKTDNSFEGQQIISPIRFAKNGEQLIIFFTVAGNREIVLEYVGHYAIVYTENFPYVIV